ncbi:MAG: hypothetical protein IKT67_12585 [Lachnospiraceae bacterium]|nr:hypothetical protein [Lachnospiraceae bacterium]
MKKVNWSYILIVIACVLGVSALASLMMGIIGGNFAGFGGVMFVFVFIIGIVALVSHFESNFITNGLMKKTLKKDEQALSFQNSSTFTSNNAILMIDEATGRLGYIYYLNPTKFVTVSAKNITEIKSDYIKGPLGGTRYVYFQFVYEGQRIRVATFTSRNMYSLQSGEVLEAMSKADAYAALLERTKSAAQ